MTANGGRRFIMRAGRFTPGAMAGSVLCPRIRKPGRRVIVYSHGAGGWAAEIVSSLPSIAKLMRRACDEGYIIVCPSQTQQWANDTSDQHMDDAVAWARTNLDASDEPPILIGASHGGAASLGYALDNDVHKIVALIPAVDVEFARSNNTMGLRGAIDLAWGVTYPEPLPVIADPAQNDPGVPTQVWAASDDIVSQNAESWAAGLPHVEYHDVGALGHTDAAIAAADIDMILDFIQ